MHFLLLTVLLNGPLVHLALFHHHLRITARCLSNIGFSTTSFNLPNCRSGSITVDLLLRLFQADLIVCNEGQQKRVDDAHFDALHTVNTRLARLRSGLIIQFVRVFCRRPSAVQVKIFLNCLLDGVSHAIDQRRREIAVVNHIWFEVLPGIAMLDVSR